MSNGDFKFFLPVAMRKLNDLLRRGDFRAIEDINFLDFTVIIRFKTTRCKIDKFGRVEWMGLL